VGVALYVRLELRKNENHPKISFLDGHSPRNEERGSK